MSNNKKLRTPVGRFPVPDGIATDLDNMTDRQVADRALSGGFIEPYAYSELLERGLSGPGMFKEDTYRLIEQREAATK